MLLEYIWVVARSDLGLTCRLLQLKFFIISVSPSLQVDSVSILISSNSSFTKQFYVARGANRLKISH